ncbi:MAG TPA: hypothetical protein ENN18_09840 [Proteobacteria bacterium]|nr:hypothetical protein [Pseudomonadota bacterium]
MKVKEISVSVAKKITKEYNSYQLIYSATAEIAEGEKYLKHIEQLRGELSSEMKKFQVANNGNGGNTKQ